MIPLRRRAAPAAAVLSLSLLAACDPAEFQEPGAANEPTTSVAAALTGDLTPSAIAFVSDYHGRPAGAEGLDKVFDNNTSTKLYLSWNQEWIQYRMATPAVINNYAVTSANDFEDRDPKNWTLQGSKDGVAWVVLDTRTNEDFPSRFQTKEYAFANTTQYLYYRLDITDNAGDSNGDMQLAEFRIGGTTTTGMPGSPTISTIAAGATSASLTWSPVSSATGYFVQRIGDDGISTVEVATGSGTLSYTDSGLAPGTTYLYQVQAVNGAVRGTPSAQRGATTARISVAGLKDLTGLASVLATDESGKTGFEGAEEGTDNNVFTKYLRMASQTTWIRLQVPAGSVATRYTITSGNDFPGRDPRDWTLEGSPDGSSWTPLDTRANQGFADRYQTRVYPCNTAGTGYNYYRLRVTANHGDANVQMAEWRLYGTSSATLAAPAAPTTLTAEVLSANQVKLVWADNARQLNPETVFDVDRSSTSTFPTGSTTVTKAADLNSIEFRATQLTRNTTYWFRVRARNAAGASAYSNAVQATTIDDTPPTSFVENGWYWGRNRTVTRTFFNSNIAVYYDPFVPSPASITWLNPIMDEVWTYTKNTYGSLGNPYLYVIGDQVVDTYGWLGGVLFRYDATAWYKQMIFSTSPNWLDSDQLGWNLLSLVHELSHQVEYSTNDVHGTPSASIWGDSKFADVFMYDAFSHMTTVRSTLAEELSNQLLDDIDDWGVLFWANWYRPIYTGAYGNTAAANKGTPFLVKYFQLLAQNLPKPNGRYYRSLNLGEFVHFFAAAAGVDLRDEARATFRWTALAELQLAKAQADFPALTALYNAAPVFTTDPIARTATVNVALAGQTLAGTATDANPVDPLTFSKVSGATWITVAADGTLTGTPPSAGTHTAVVRVTDGSGATDDATLTFTVSGGTTPVTLLSDGFESSFDLWTDGGATDWDRATDQKHGGSFAARCGSADTNLTSDNLNTSGKQSFTVTLWYRDSGVDDDDDVFLQFYNGTSYVNRVELGNSTENVWNQVTVTVNAAAEPTFFRTNFRIRVAGSSIDTSEFLWIDDVTVTAQ